MRYEREFSSKQNLKGRLSKDEDHKKNYQVCVLVLLSTLTFRVS